jgi:hypothetical protein
MQFMFYDPSDGFDVTTGESFSHISWKDVLKIVEQAHFLQIHLSKYDIRIIPKRGFQARDIDDLRAILRSSIGPKAKVLGSSRANTPDRL